MPDVIRPKRYFDAYIFDMDGTLYLGDEWIRGARDVIAQLRQRRIPVRFLSNNPTHTTRQYADKLARMGLPTPEHEIVNPVVATRQWLLDNHAEATVYPIGEEPLVSALRDAGIRISDRADQIDIVIASYDRTFTYAKLQIAFDAIWYHRRARLITTNPDRYCPMPDGRGQPDAAAIVAAIEAATGAQCEHNMGKPSPAIARAALAGLDVPLGQCVMVGDRLSTDVELAFRSGMRSALVLTGESTLQSLEQCQRKPDFVLPSVAELLPA